MHCRVLTILPFGLASVTALGQSPGVSEFLQLNAYTTQFQFQPSLASDGSGGFIAVWESFGQDGSGRGVFGRRFDALGAPVSDEFPVNSYTTGEQNLPQVAADSDGNFVVVWAGQRVNDLQGATLRIFDNTGFPIFPIEREVHPGTNDTEDLARVARNDERFIVVWRGLVPISGYELRGQLFDPNSDTIGAHFQIAAFTTATIRDPAVAIDDTGNFVVAWAQYEVDGSASGIQARLYNEDGVAITGVLPVNTYTTGFQLQPSVAMDGEGGFVVAWDNGEVLEFPIHARRYDATGAPLGDQFLIGHGLGPILTKRDLGGYGAVWAPGRGSALEAGAVEGQRFDESFNLLGSPFRLSDIDVTQAAFARTVCGDVGRQYVFAWQDFTPNGTTEIFARRGGFPDGAPFAVDARSGGSTTGNLNGVLEVGERVFVDQAYQNSSGLPYPLAGTASNWTGPAGLSYTIHDPTADYGTLPGLSAAGDSQQGAPVSDCFTATANCFEFELTGTRTPGLHWDTTYDEALSESVFTTRTLHIGGSFTDVPAGDLFYRFIETLFHTSVTGGCSAGQYCPVNPVTRGQMAVFLLKSKFGAEHVPPQPTGSVFTDVPASHPFAPWIEQLAALGITGGCGGGNYCPNASVNRQQMAVFLLKTDEGSAYTPPAAAGIFQDVPLDNPFVAWVEELYNRQITGGCSTSPLLYCPTNAVNRGQMSAFLTKTFLLALYGP